MFPQNKKKHVRGFSLVELMVSISVFAIVMTISVGTLLVLINANSKAQALHAVMTNISFAIDNMTRSIRTGHDFYCAGSGSNLPSNPGNCNDGSIIVFTDGETGDRTGYRLNGSVLEWRDESISNWLDVTSSDITIARFEVTVEDSENSDDMQPRATILIEGYINNNLDTDTDFRLQTIVTQRILDY